MAPARQVLEVCTVLGIQPGPGPALPQAIDLPLPLRAGSSMRAVATARWILDQDLGCLLWRAQLQSSAVERAYRALTDESMLPIAQMWYARTSLHHG